MLQLAFDHYQGMTIIIGLPPLQKFFGELFIQAVSHLITSLM